jgi:hypothetical protein
MKQLILLGLATLFFSCSTIPPTSSQTTAEGGGSPTASENPDVIFEYIPQDVDLLITFKAADAYENKYKDNVSGFKSFAQSEGGAWAYVTNRVSQQTANLQVLDSCKKHNVRFADTYPCSLINVSGKWLKSPNRAKEILASLPRFIPEAPIDLQQLSSNARDDMRNNNYPMALAKRVWFHQHALEVDKHYVGVRLSFSLSDWVELGNIYPPAKTLLRYVANYAKRSLMDDPQDSFSLVQEYLSLNWALERTDQSISFFKWLDSNHPDEASANFHVFQDVLSKQKQFLLYNKYISPNANFSQMASNYNRSINANKRGDYGDKKTGQKMLEFETKNFIHNVSRLVAILVINEREAEANNLVAKAKLELDSDEFVTLLNSALDGKLPLSRY